ncbi:hypothetical protein V490_06896 [Pseudogymnoascus sp. VKM F-3557]|nr:hypothetical protein V490_06896 [Pseudogymnoascus sp. VKM F-3557]
MSQPVDSQGWDRFKNVIRGLYMIKGHKLEGPKGVIKIMETQHGFKKSKAQYGKQFKEWGFTKNRTKRDWQIMNRKIQRRERTGKGSDVYQDGRLMTAEKLQKETSRQGYMTTVEQFRHSLEAAPQTPPGFDIRTPLAQPFIRLAFENLPIFQFQELARPIYETISPSSTSSISALATVFQSPGQRKDNGIPPILHSLLPMSAFIEEPRAAGLAIQRVEDIGHVELLNLAIFMTSNNFPGDTDSYNLRMWLRTHNNTSVLEALSSTEGPTAEALVENIFRFAIEDRDVSTVKYLLRTGVNLNERRYFSNYDDGITPLQFALIKGNTEMALELINAGSTIDEPNTGRKSSALVLAIIGDRAAPRDYPASKHAPKHLINLVSSLINAGAVINFDLGFVQTYPSEEFIYDTPLSAASRDLRKDIVDLLIQHGADAFLENSWACSALHECLCSTGDMESYLRGRWLMPLQYRRTVPYGSNSPEAVIDVACSLIKAGANVDEEFYCNPFFALPHGYSGPESYTIFDVGVFTGSIEVVNLLIFAGARITLLSVEYAIQFQSFDAINQLLLTGASVWTKSIANIEAHQIESYDLWIKEVAFFKAIHLGHVSTIECLFNYGTFRFEDVLNKSAELTKAIERCSSEGHVETLRLILQSILKCQFSPSQWFGDSLYMAILEGRSDVIDILLSAGANVHKMGPEGETPLLAAISKGQDKVIDALLSAGADINAMGPKGETPLRAAIVLQNESLFNRIISMGAIPNQQSQYNSVCSAVHSISGDALIEAIMNRNFVAIDHLLENGADIEAFGTSQERNEKQCRCITPLAAALMNNNKNLARDLIRRGVKVNNQLHTSMAQVPPFSRVGMTPLAAAIFSEDFEAVDIIIHKGASPFDSYAIRATEKYPQLRKVLLNALHHSYEPSTIECVKIAIEIRDMEMARTILYNPIWGVTIDITSALEYAMTLEPELYETTVSLVKILLEAGAETGKDIQFDGYYSPVQSAVRTGYHSVAQALLEYGSNPNSVSVNCLYVHNDYRTPLQIAVEEQDLEMIKILFNYNADVNGTAIDEYEAYNDEHKCHHFLPRTPLQEASINGSKEIVELMLEHGADVNCPPVTGYGATALQYAAIYGFLGIAHLLLEHGADVNAPPANTDGRTALEGAAEHGRIDMVQLLLNAGANIFGDGQTQYENATRRASENGHHAIRRILEKRHGERE